MRLFRTIPLVFTLLLAAFSAKGQTIPFNINLYDQWSIDHFEQNFGPFTDIAGRLIIGPPLGQTWDTDIRDLTPLKTLKTVGGMLYIYRCPRLKSLAGLENLDSIGISPLAEPNSWEISLVIAENDSLKNLKGLDSLRYMPKGLLQIDKNDALESLEGLGSFEQTELFWVRFNKNLQSLDGLNSFKKFVRPDFANLNIDSNPRLKDIGALSGVTMPKGGDIQIYKNDSLQFMPDIYIDSASQIEIWRNYLLEGIELSKLKYVRHLYIDSNYALKNIQLPKLETVGWFNPISVNDKVEGHLDIQKNTALQRLNLNGLKTIFPNFILKFHPFLEELKLESLDTTYLSIDISSWPSNKKLKQIDGLNKLRAIGQSLYISYWGALEHLPDFDSLKHIGRALGIGGDSSLVDLGGLPDRLETIGLGKTKINVYDYRALGFSLNSTNPIRFTKLRAPDGVSFSMAFSMTDTIRFDHMDNIMKATIWDNPRLKVMEAPELKNTTTHQAWQWPNNSQVIIDIANNDSLTTLKMFNRAKPPKDSFLVRGNPLLTDCEAVCRLIEKGMPKSRIRIAGSPAPCSSLAEIEDEVCDSLTDVGFVFPEKHQNLLRLAPNPASERVAAQWPAQVGPAALVLTESLGRVAARFSIAPGQTAAEIELSEFCSGVYFLRLESADGVRSEARKLVVQH